MWWEHATCGAGTGLEPSRCEHRITNMRVKLCDGDSTFIALHTPSWGHTTWRRPVVLMFVTFLMCANKSMKHSVCLVSWMKQDVWKIHLNMNRRRNWNINVDNTEKSNTNNGTLWRRNFLEDHVCLDFFPVTNQQSRVKMVYEREERIVRCISLSRLYSVTASLHHTPAQRYYIDLTLCCKIHICIRVENNTISKMCAPVKWLHINATKIRLWTQIRGEMIFTLHHFFDLY